MPSKCYVSQVIGSVNFNLKIQNLNLVKKDNKLDILKLLTQAVQDSKWSTNQYVPVLVLHSKFILLLIAGMELYSITAFLLFSSLFHAATSATQNSFLNGSKP